MFYCLLLYNCFVNPIVHAWSHEILLGYSKGQEIDQDYDNEGLVFSAKFYKFSAIDETLIATIDVTFTNIKASTKDHDHLTTLALTLAMRGYFLDPSKYHLRPYIQASFGPVYLFVKQLGTREQGSNFAFQTSLETGTEMGRWDLNLRILHFCNAGLAHPNEGINLAPIVSIGYLF